MVQTHQRPLSALSPDQIIEEKKEVIGWGLKEFPEARIVAVDAAPYLSLFDKSAAFSLLPKYIDFEAASSVATAEDIDDTFAFVFNYEGDKHPERRLQREQYAEIHQAEDQLRAFHMGLVNAVEEGSQKEVVSILGATTGGQVLALVK